MKCISRELARVPASSRQTYSITPNDTLVRMQRAVGSWLEARTTCQVFYVCTIAQNIQPRPCFVDILLEIIPCVCLLSGVASLLEMNALRDARHNFCSAASREHLLAVARTRKVSSFSTQLSGEFPTVENNQLKGTNHLCSKMVSERSCLPLSTSSRSPGRHLALQSGTISESDVER